MNKEQFAENSRLVDDFSGYLQHLQHNVRTLRADIAFATTHGLKDVAERAVTHLLAVHMAQRAVSVRLGEVQLCALDPVYNRKFWTSITFN